MRFGAWPSWVCGAAVAVGVGTAALVAGEAVAHADVESAHTTAQHSAVGHSARPSSTRPSSAAPRRAAPAATSAASVPASVLERSGVARPARATIVVPPVATTVTAPTPADAAQTPYGDVGKWMIRSDGKVADWGGKTYRGKAIYEPVNVIIIDPTSTSAAESTRKLNATMAMAGFPAMALHSVGFQAAVNGQSYGQQPTALLQAYSDAFFLLPNNHGRVFGPAPGPGGIGYVWTASFSRERIGLYDLLPAHLYVSFGRARSALRYGLVRAGATDLGLVALDNSVETPTTTTGDHDGYAAAIMLR